MHNLVSKRFQRLFFLVLFLVSASAQSESEYDMYRAPPLPAQSLVVLDLSMKMACAPDQPIPSQGEIACGYDTTGEPPYSPDPRKQAQSRLAIVKRAFSDYAQSGNNALSHVGLATMENGGSVIRVPIAAAESTRDEFMQALEMLSVGEKTSLIGALLEIGNYFSGQDVVFGRERAAYRNQEPADLMLSQQYNGYLPRWLAQTISHPSTVINGDSLVVREPACRDDLTRIGSMALIEPACASEHYSAAGEFSVRYRVPALPVCATSDAQAPGVPRRDVLVVVSQDMLQASHLDQEVAGEPVGVWINRFLSGDKTAQGFNPACSANLYAAGEAGSENCSLALVENLRSKHNVHVSVVAVGHQSEYLARLTMAGGGRYYSVDNAQDLRVVLEAILPAFSSQETPTIAPVISSMLPMTTAEGERTLLTTQFQAGTGSAWLGNVKRYGVSADHSQLQIHSDQGDASILQTCGDGHWQCVSPTARSAWTQTARSDGNVVTRGGVADTLPPVERRSAFVQLGRDRVPLQPVTSVAALSQDQRAVVERIARAYGWQGTSLLADTANPLVSRGLARYNQFAGVDADNAEYERLKLVGMEPWLHRPEESNSLGASVFGSPLLITYDSTTTARKKVLWWSGTDGFLRAIDADSGDWLTSILPEAALTSVIVAEQDWPQDIASGLDTSWMALQHDHNHDGVIRRADGDYVYLYGGLRRAGHHVLAWDVTEPEAPQLLFDISSSTPGFEALAQAWSSPILAQMRLPGDRAPQTVLVFGGGYDGRFDSSTAQPGAACEASASACAAAIYFVQASGTDLGRLLWSIDSRSGQNQHTQVPSMTSPVTASVKAVDIEGDGITDYLYAVDLGGNLFRIDLPSQNDGEGSIAVSLLASLAANVPERDNAFFLAPSISLSRNEGQALGIVVALGSGRIPQPVSSRDRGSLYLFMDDVAAAPDVVPLSVDSSLAVDLSVTPPAASVGKRLWVIPTRERGEKLMASPIIFDHKAFFLTYVPPASDASVCEQNSGGQRLWGIDTRTAQPVLNNAGQVDPITPTVYGGTEQPPMLTRLSSLSVADEVYLLQGWNTVPTGTLYTQPERVRWQQVLVGPRVRPH